MLGYKSCPNREPVYDYYLETDLDTFDEPVDYSTKYKEQDGYKDNRTNFKVRNGDVGSQSTKGINCNDEVKVYCLHSSPLTISPASSLSDLRIASSNDELLTTNCGAEKSEEKYHPETINDCIESESIKVGSACESEKDSSPKESPKNKNNSRKEKCVTFGGSSVTETPLMFSRSSSVDSLSSFEQHSIIDDRSYVSAISTPGSGMISPSELPASPSELMPPSNPKSKPAFQFPAVKNSNPKDLTISIDFKLKECDVICNGVFDDSQKVFNEEGKFSTTSSLSALSFGDGSSRISISLFDEKRNSVITGKSSSNVSDDAAPSYVFNDTKKEYKYEGQLVALNKNNIYKPQAAINACHHQPNLQTVFRSYLPEDEQQECPQSLSYVFEDAKNVYNDEGKFSTTSSLSSISFHDHVEPSPAIFQSQYSLSSLVDNFTHPAANSKDPDPKNLEIHNECSKSNDTSSDSDTSLNGESPLDQDVKLHTSWKENSPPSTSTCSKELLQPNELQVCSTINDSEESEYDSEQEREDQFLIHQLLQPTVKLDKCPISFKDSGAMLEIPFPMDKNNSAKNLPAKNKNKAKCNTRLDSLHSRQESSPAQTESSESEYDSDQERKDEAIINELFSGSKALQKPTLDMFKSLTPKPRTSAPPNIFTCKAVRTPQHVQEKTFLKEQVFDSHVQESSESEYDSEQERKDQEEIKKLMQCPMPKTKNQPLDQEDDGLQSSASKSRNHAPPKMFTAKAQAESKHGVDVETQSYDQAHYMRCPPVELYEVSSESEYDSEQEREDEELINRLLSQTVHIQVSNTGNLKPGVAFEACIPVDFVDAPRNFCACNVPRPACIGQQDQETQPPQDVQYEQEHNYARHYRRGSSGKK